MTPISRSLPAFSSAVRYLHDERDVVSQRGDDVLGIDDLNGLIGDDAGRRYHAALVTVDANGARLLAGVLYDQALDVQNDVGDVLDDARDRADFVLNALDLEARDRASLQAGQQDPAQAIADSHAEAAFERLRVEPAVGVCEGAAVGHEPRGQFQTSPSDTHVRDILLCTLDLKTRRAARGIESV
jgi:hypothetical protein